MADNIVTGVVENVSTKYGKYSVQVNGEWYGTNPEWLKVKPEVGDNITFDSGPDGRKYLKNPRIVSGGSASSPVGASSTNDRFAFPIPLNSNQRSICRQSSLKIAVELYNNVTVNGDSLEKDADNIIALAMKFERYVTGDMDKDILKDLEAGE